MSKLIQYGNDPRSFTNDLMEDQCKMVSFSDYVNSIDKLCRNEIITPIEARELLGFDDDFFKSEEENEDWKIVCELLNSHPTIDTGYPNDPVTRAYIIAKRHCRCNR